MRVNVRGRLNRDQIKSVVNKLNTYKKRIQVEKDILVSKMALDYVLEVISWMGTVSPEGGAGPYGEFWDELNQTWVSIKKSGGLGDIVTINIWAATKRTAESVDVHPLMKGLKKIVVFAGIDGSKNHDEFVKAYRNEFGVMQPSLPDSRWEPRKRPLFMPIARRFKEKAPGEFRNLNKSIKESVFG